MQQPGPLAGLSWLSAAPLPAPGQPARRQACKTHPGPVQRTSRRCATGLCVCVCVCVCVPPELTNHASLQALRRLQERVRALSLPYTPSPEVQQWYLRDRGFDVDEAADKLATMCRWRHTFRPELIWPQDISAELQSGKAFVHDQADRFGRPVVVVQARYHLKGALAVQ